MNIVTNVFSASIPLAVVLGFAVGVGFFGVSLRIGNRRFRATMDALRPEFPSPA